MYKKFYELWYLVTGKIIEPSFVFTFSDLVWRYKGIINHVDKVSYIFDLFSMFLSGYVFPDCNNVLGSREKVYFVISETT